MRLSVDDNGLILGFAYAGGFTDDDIEIDSIPTEVESNPTDYIYINGEFVLKDEKK